MAAKKPTATQTDKSDDVVPTDKKDQKNPKAYTSSIDVQTAGQYFKAGEVFVTDAEPSKEWVEHSPEDAHAIMASVQKVPADIDLNGMDDTALAAFAATKHVDTTGMDRDQIIVAITAANEPKL